MIFSDAPSLNLRCGGLLFLDFFFFYHFLSIFSNFQGCRLESKVTNLALSLPLLAFPFIPCPKTKKRRRKKMGVVALLLTFFFLLSTSQTSYCRQTPEIGIGGGVGGKGPWHMFWWHLPSYSSQRTSLPSSPKTFLHSPSSFSPQHPISLSLVSTRVGSIGRRPTPAQTTLTQARASPAQHSIW